MSARGADGRAGSQVRVREHLIAAPDGWRLSVIDLAPTAPRALAIAGHAMMVDRRTLWRAGGPSLAGSLVERGFRVLLPDLRGHGASGPLAGDGGDWSYADLIDDTPVYVALAQRLAPGLPVGLVGHSLFGHVALAHLGQHPETPVAAVVALAVNIWRRSHDRSRRRWLQKRLAMGAVGGLRRLVGYVPAARLGFGSADEAPTYWRDLAGFMANDRWGRPGGADYRAGLGQVRCPVLQISSDGDRLLGHPDDAEDFLAALPKREVWRVGRHCSRPELRGLAPDHVPLVSRRRSQPIWRAMGEWLAAAVGV